LKYLSLFSGIEAASVAWQPLGWTPLAFAEIDQFCRALLKQRFPDVPNLGDVTKWKEWPDLGPVDLVCGGSPCQSFSVAGLRQGLNDPRGNLALVYLAIVNRYRPRWVVFENVPGLLSTDDGRAFGAFLGGLAELGYGFAYRILDAQHVRVDGLAGAVPQQRRRVFVVGCSGRRWQRAAAVLLEPEGLSGDPAPRRAKGQGIAASLRASLGRRGGKPDGAGEHAGLVREVVSTFDANYAHTQGTSGQDLNHGHSHLVAMSSGQSNATIGEGAAPALTCIHEAPVIASYRIGGDGGIYDEGETSAPLTTGTDSSANVVLDPVAFTTSDQANGFAWEREVWQTLDAQLPNDSSNIQKGIRQGFAVRRLMPVECERLQGFEDDWTLIDYRGKPATDSPRYKAIGNAWPVNVARWIGQRIDMVEILAAAAQHKRGAA
jgi:DNA (cytosine-5)-methyltransferase 1